MYWLSTAMFLLAAGWCSYRLHRARPLPGTLVAGAATASAYVLMVTSRELDMGSAAVALVLLDLTVVLLGTQAVLALLSHFDPPTGDEDDSDDGHGGGGGGDDPRPASWPGGGPEGVRVAVDWSGFDIARERWEERDAAHTAAPP